MRAKKESVSVSEFTQEDWEELTSMQLSNKTLATLNRFEWEQKLKPAQWEEIQQEVENKLGALRAGIYGTDRLARDWREHLKEIKTKVGAKL